MAEAQVISQFLLATPQLSKFQLSFLQCFLWIKSSYFFPMSATVILCSISESYAGEVIVPKKGVCVCQHEKNPEKTGLAV